MTGMIERGQKLKLQEKSLQYPIKPEKFPGPSINPPKIPSPYSQNYMNSILVWYYSNLQIVLNTKTIPALIEAPQNTTFTILPSNLACSSKIISKLHGVFFLENNQESVHKIIINCLFACDVTATMLVVKNKSIYLFWELNSIFM